MNSVHEFIAFFVQRGSCIESIYLRKEKQRHFCQDTYFRSPPSFDSHVVDIGTKQLAMLLMPEQKKRVVDVSTKQKTIVVKK